MARNCINVQEDCRMLKTVLPTAAMQPVPVVTVWLVAYSGTFYPD